jgi:hypothetical protein
MLGIGSKHAFGTEEKIVLYLIVRQVWQIAQHILARCHWNVYEIRVHWNTCWIVNTRHCIAVYCV